MITTTVGPLPGSAEVLREQVRSIGLANRRELAAFGLLLLVYVVANIYVSFRIIDRAAVPWRLDQFPGMAVTLAFFVPIAVWKAAEPSRRAYFWAMPVERGSHTLTRVFSGWLYLMGLIAAVILLHLALLPLLNGHVSLGRGLLLVGEGGAGGPPVLGSGEWLIDRPLADYPWFWLAPFTAATIAYLFSSITILSTDHPWRWYAGLLITGFMLLVAIPESGIDPPLVESVAFGRYGAWSMIFGLTEQAYVLETAAGDPVRGMLRHPDFRAWAVATLIWGAVAIAGLLFAAYRHQER